jgi:hypothetical protein
MQKEATGLLTFAKTWRAPQGAKVSQRNTRNPVKIGKAPISKSGAVMSDEFSFNGEDDAKAEIRAATRYLLKGAAGSDRGDIVSEIIAIVNEVARSAGEDPLDDGMPGG